MADYVASKIFNGLTPNNFNNLMQVFGVKLSTSDDATKTPGDKLEKEWHTLLKSGEPSGTSPRQHHQLRSISGLHDFLQRLHNLTESKCDVVRLARDLAESSVTQFELPPDFENWSPYNRGTYVFLNNETLWENLCNLSTARNKESSRLWIDYYGLPAVTPNATQDNIDIMEKLLIEHFKETKRSDTCKVDSYVRKHQYYFFATLCDTPRYDEVSVESIQVIIGANSGEADSASGKSEMRKQGFDYIPLVHPFRIIFAYDERGQFSIYGELAKSDFDPLAQKLVNALVGYDGRFQRAPKNAYYLDGLKDRNFDFKIEATDSIESIKVSALKFHPSDDEYTTMSICNRQDDIYDRLDRYLNRERLCNDSIDLKRATLTLKMCEGFRPFRSFSFDISLDSCNTKSLEDAQRELAEKYIRKLGFIRFPDITLNSILKAAHTTAPVISSMNYAEGFPQVLRTMLDFRLIVETGDATEVRDGDDMYKVVPLTNEEGETVMGYVDCYGNPHIVTPLVLKRYKVIFDLLVKCIRDELHCTGAPDVLLPERAWYLGVAGSEHRDAYLIRNWSTDREVQERIKVAKPGSLVFYLGQPPDIVQIGYRRSDAKEDGDRLEAQYYRADSLIEYTQEAGYVFRADIVRQKLKDMQAAIGSKKTKGKPLPGKQETYQRKLETWIWTWFDAKLRAAKAITDFTGDPDPDINPAWLDQEYMTQKEVCDEAGIDYKCFSRAKKVWEKDVTGFGLIFFRISETFIMRRPLKDKANDGRAAERLNDFYRTNKDVIDELRQRRPHTL